jgi:hypothetical protein
VNDHAATIGRLRQRVGVEQIGASRFSAERPDCPFSLLCSCEPDGEVPPGNKLADEPTP